MSNLEPSCSAGRREARLFVGRATTDVEVLVVGFVPPGTDGRKAGPVERTADEAEAETGDDGDEGADATGEAVVFIEGRAPVPDGRLGVVPTSAT